MAIKHVVVDGSNIATEGRSLPSLKQLREAISAFEADHKGTKITVVVDASFSHRVEAKERRGVELAEERGEFVSPPAGAIGRGDAFLLKIAQKIGAAVLSNDSFQEFHDEHKWLFDSGRLIGGKPVNGIGWIFTERSPVRVRNSASRAVATNAPTPQERVMDRAIAAATKEIVAEGAKGANAPKAVNKENEPVNEPLIFIQFIAEHHIGSEVKGTVDRFTAHGAFVVIGSARCYIPLTGMGTPPPRSPRSVLTKGEKRTFIVKAVNPARRDIELALPPIPKVEEKPKTAETPGDVSESKSSGKPGKTSESKPSKRSTTAKKPARSRISKPSVANKGAKSPVAKRPANVSPRKGAKRTSSPVARKSSPTKRTKKSTAAKRTTKPAKKTSANRAVKAVKKKATPKRKPTVRRNNGTKAVGNKSTQKSNSKKKTTVKKSVTKKASTGSPSTARRRNATKSNKRRGR